MRYHALELPSSAYTHAPGIPLLGLVPRTEHSGKLRLANRQPRLSGVRPRPCKVITFVRCKLTGCMPLIE